MGRVRGTFRYFITIITGMIIGLLIGMLTINTLLSYRIDQFHKRISYLEKVIEDNEVKIKKYQESINKSKYILKDIKVELIYEGDELESIVLEKHIKEKYSNLIGKDVKSIDIDMAADIVDGRIMVIGDKEYKLRVSRITLTEVLVIRVQVRV